MTDGRVEVEEEAIGAEDSTTEEESVEEVSEGLVWEWEDEVDSVEDVLTVSDVD